MNACLIKFFRVFLNFQFLLSRAMHINCISRDVMVRIYHLGAYRVLGVWNSLLESVTFSSLGAFKLTVRTVEFSKF